MPHRFASRNFRDRVGLPAVTNSKDVEGGARREWSDDPNTWEQVDARVEFVNPLGNASVREVGPAPFGETHANVIFKDKPTTPIYVEMPLYHIKGGRGDITPADVYTCESVLNDRGLLYSVTIVRRS